MSSSNNNCFTVDVVQLQNSDGTRNAVVNGLEDEERTFDCLCGDTIQSLKEKKNAAFFSHAPRPLGRIKVFSSHQHAAAAASSSPQWTHRQRHEALQQEEGALYGFIDVFKIKQQQQLRYGKCWFVACSRVSVTALPRKTETWKELSPMLPMLLRVCSQLGWFQRKLLFPCSQATDDFCRYQPYTSCASQHFLLSVS